jgi:hypothetical protein
VLIVFALYLPEAYNRFVFPEFQYFGHPVLRQKPRQFHYQDFLNPQLPKEPLSCHIRLHLTDHNYKKDANFDKKLQNIEKVGHTN